MRNPNENADYVAPYEVIPLRRSVVEKMVEMADDRWLSAESALRAIKAVLVAALRVDAPAPCPWCNDEGIVHTHDGQIIGPCECALIDGSVVSSGEGGH